MAPPGLTLRIPGPQADALMACVIFKQAVVFGKHNMFAE